MKENDRFLGICILVASLIVALAMIFHTHSIRQVGRYQYLSVEDHSSLYRIDTTTGLPLLLKQVGNNEFVNPNSARGGHGVLMGFPLVLFGFFFLGVVAFFAWRMGRTGDEQRSAETERALMQSMAEVLEKNESGPKEG